MFPKDSVKGNMSLIILSTLIDGDRYGYEITKKIHSLTSGEIQLKEGSLYPALHKLEKEGLVKGYWSQQEPGKPNRKYYALTDEGRKAVEVERKRWISFMGTMRRVIYGEENS